ncbi:hypothetical protein ES702_01309 [subsurface metagenome]
MRDKKLLTAFLVCLLFLVMMVSGCVPGRTLSEVTAPNRANLLKLSIGMSKQEAIDMMGTDEMTVFYRPPYGGVLRRKTIIITNPYRSEIFQGKDKTLEIIYYVTDVKRDDGVITDDELTPLVFDNGTLIGWGWSFLVESVKKYEIRIR